MRTSSGRTTAVTVGPREFIRAWQESGSVAEVAQKVRARKNTVRVRAFRYRGLGIPLKVFPPVEVEPIDWDELARYAAELVGAGADPTAGGEEPAAE